MTCTIIKKCEQKTHTNYKKKKANKKILTSIKKAIKQTLNEKCFTYYFGMI